MALPPKRDLTSCRVVASSLTSDSHVLLSSNVLWVSLKTLVLKSSVKLHHPRMRTTGWGSIPHPEVPTVLGRRYGTAALNPGTFASLKLTLVLLRVWASKLLPEDTPAVLRLEITRQARLGSLVWEAGHGELGGRPSPRAHLGSACCKQSPSCSQPRDSPSARALQGLSWAPSPLPRLPWWGDRARGDDHAG